MIEDEPTLVPTDARPESPIRMFGLGIGRSAFVPPQPRGWSFLVWAWSGSVAVRVRDRLALASGDAAVWVPEGTPFGVEARAACGLRIAYVARGAVGYRAFGAVMATPVLQAILERAVTSGYLDPHVSRDARLLAVALDELRALEPAPRAFELTLPNDASLRAAIDRALGSDAPGAMPVRDLALACGLAVRTLERRFVAETGLTPRAWLRRARLHAAVAALASGATITEAGFAAGYGSSSAFIAAYGFDFGVSPGRARLARARLRNT